MSAANPQAKQLNEALYALSHFFNMATNENGGGARAAAMLLLGLYNGPRFPFDLTDLRLFDESNLNLAIALLRFDARPAMEVHDWLNKLYGRNDFGARFEQLAHDWRVKGRCKKEWLRPLERIGMLQIGGAA